VPDANEFHKHNILGMFMPLNMLFLIRGYVLDKTDVECIHTTKAWVGSCNLQMSRGDFKKVFLVSRYVIQPKSCAFRV